MSHWSWDCEIYNLVAILVEFDMDSLLLFPPYFRRSVRLVINQSVGSCRVELIPEVGVVYPLFAIKGYLFYIKYVIYLCIVSWYYLLFVAICEIWLLRLTYGAYLILFLKSGITNYGRKAHMSGLHRDINMHCNYLTSRRVQKPRERAGDRADLGAGRPPSPLGRPP